MKIEKCSQGHFYDSEKYESCPFCAEQGAAKRTSAKPCTEESFPGQIMGKAREQESHFNEWAEAAKVYDENRTVLDFESDRLMVHRFVTGWLVCVEGPERGRDYRLRFGFNQIGRSHKMDVCIFEDDEISRGIHCSVVYEDRKNVFMLVPGNGTFTYKDDRLLENPVRLMSGDRFRIGETVLEFIAFCREGVTWEEK